MELECKKCMVSFTVDNKDLNKYKCSNCGERLTIDFAHDGKTDVTPSLIKRMVLRPLN
jgi:PHP family Zn ribbon phosphoesterase